MDDNLEQKSQRSGLLNCSKPTHVSNRIIFSAQIKNYVQNKAILLKTYARICVCLFTLMLTCGVDLCMVYNIRKLLFLKIAACIQIFGLLLKNNKRLSVVT